MAESKIERDKLQIAILQRDVVRNGGFYLAGGSGLALRLGHRFSEDLDWFTDRRFAAGELGAKLGSLSRVGRGGSLWRQFLVDDRVLSIHG